MDTILQQLYDGKIFPAEQYRPTVEEYKKLYKKHYQHYEDFIKELSQLQKPLDTRFVEIMDEQLDTIPYEISNMFIDGFRLGARMMIEVQIAAYYGRFCGAKRPQCEAERPGFLLI